MKFLSAGPTRRLRFSPDGRYLLIAGASLWELPAGVQRHARLPIYDGVFAASDVLVGFQQPQTVVRVDLDSGALIGPRAEPPTRGHLWPPRVSPDGTRLVAGNLGPFGRPVLYWWSLPDLKLLEEWEQEEFPMQLHGLAFTADGAGLAVLDRSDSVGLFDVSSRRLRWRATFHVVQDRAWLTVSPCGRRIATGSGRHASIFDVSHGGVVGELHQKQKYFLDGAFTSDGRFLGTVSNEKTVKFWDTSSWTLRHELAWQIGGLRAIAFSRDGMLAAAGGLGRKVVVWDLDL